MTGVEVKGYVISNGVKLWKIAEGLGISETSLSRKLRHDVSKEDFERIKELVERFSNK